MTKIEELAELMNVKATDLAGYVACLKVWIDKGYNLEQAIELHTAQMARMVANADNPALIEIAQSCYDELRAA